MMTKTFVLGSSSPRRKELLKQIGYTPVKIVSADIDESPVKNELPREYVKRMARGKNDAVVALLKDEKLPVLTADTIVCLGRRILGKPKDEEEAKRFLHMLSGRKHTVLGAICLSFPDGRKIERLVATKVVFKQLTDQEINYYVQTGDPMDKAGSYGCQGYAGCFIRSVLGSYTNVVGLCLYTVRNMLEAIPDDK